MYILLRLCPSTFWIKFFDLGRYWNLLVSSITKFSGSGKSGVAKASWGIGGKGEDEIESDKHEKAQPWSVTLFREGGRENELMDTGENTRWRGCSNIVLLHSCGQCGCSWLWTMWMGERGGGQWEIGGWGRWEAGRALKLGRLCTDWNYWKGDFAWNERKFAKVGFQSWPPSFWWVRAVGMTEERVNRRWRLWSMNN